MSRRPRFWLHRSSRFWGGFLLLLLLLGGWLYTSLGGVQAGRWQYKHKPRHSTSLVISADRGGIGFSYKVNPYFESVPAARSPTGWYLVSFRNGARLMPEFIWQSHDDPGLARKEFVIFLPLWIPLVLWIACWLRWMRRGDQGEDALYGGDPPSFLENSL